MFLCGWFFASLQRSYFLHDGSFIAPYPCFQAHLVPIMEKNILQMKSIMAFLIFLASSRGWVTAVSAMTQCAHFAPWKHLSYLAACTHTCMWVYVRTASVFHKKFYIKVANGCDACPHLNVWMPAELREMGNAYMVEQQLWVTDSPNYFSSREQWMKNHSSHNYSLLVHLLEFLKCEQNPLPIWLDENSWPLSLWNYCLLLHMEENTLSVLWEALRPGGLHWMHMGRQSFVCYFLVAHWNERWLGQFPVNQKSAADVAPEQNRN